MFFKYFFITSCKMAYFLNDLCRQIDPLLIQFLFHQQLVIITFNRETILLKKFHLNETKILVLISNDVLL